MPYLVSLTENIALLDISGAYPDTAGPLIDLPRGLAPLSRAEREFVVR